MPVDASIAEPRPYAPPTPASLTRLLSRSWTRLAMGLPLMRPKETWLFRFYIENRRSMVEFGAGTSTLYALRHGVGKLVSVESDPIWIDLLREKPRCAAAEATGRLEFVHVDIGPTALLAKPVDDSGRQAWPRYSTDVWSRLTERPDVVFVDGRFRVACALAAACHCGEDVPILVHDYFPRPHYRVIGDHLSLEAAVGSLAVFRGFRRPADAIMAASTAHASDPR